MTPREPALVDLRTAGVTRSLVWRFDAPRRVASSASVGPGLGDVTWICNAQVPLDFARTDLEEVASTVAGALQLAGPGILLLTAAAIDRRERATDGAVTVDATVGISKPTWAAAAGGFTPWTPGTINVVAHLPVAMTDAALVGAVVTVTEAKTQALLDGGVPGTGTASDAVVVVAPRADAAAAAPQRFAGPRSEIGASLARAVFAAVRRRAGAAPVVEGTRP